MRNVDREHWLTWGFVFLLTLAALVWAYVWFSSALSAIQKAPQSLERIADALDRAFPIPAEQDPR